ncbi:MAG: bifunctional diguanylate cyclase/phosphodiesterase [Ilumatobacteraceae bacterium]
MDGVIRASEETDEDPAVPSRARLDPRTPVRVVVLLSIAQVVGAVVLVTLRPTILEPIVPWPLWTVVLIAGGFAAAEVMVFHIEFRREALTYTLTEVPTAFALVFLGAAHGLAACLLGTFAVMLFVRRVAWFKFFFNSSMFVFEMALGYFLLDVLLESERVAGLRLLLSLLVMLPLLTTQSSALVLVVISLFEGGFRERLNANWSVFWLYGMSGIIATVAVAVALRWPAVSVLAVVPIFAVWNLLRTHTKTSQRLRDLEELHQLSSSVGRSLHSDEVASLAIDEVQRLLRCDRAALVLYPFDNARGVVAASVGAAFAGLPDRVDDANWVDLIGSRSNALVPLSSMPSSPSSPTAGDGNIILAVVRDGNRVVGLLAVGDRAGVADSFDDGDAIRAGAIADRLSLALRNAELHGKIEYEAWHDRLTGLANRTFFERALDDALDGDDPTGRVAVLMMGVDQFREVNATLGHQAGDRVLLELTRRVSALLGPDDVLGRMAGDEFALLVRVADGDDSETLARQIFVAAQAPFTIDGFDVVVTLSIGSVLCPNAAINASTILRQADIAMHWAKTHHTSPEQYRDEIDRRTPERLSMLTDLRAALEHEDLEAYFQPKLDLVSGLVVGAEALVRWRHPTRGYVPPLDFVPLAETTGLITLLTNQILRKSVATIRLLDDLGFRLNVSVNLSTLDLVDEQIIDRVSSCLSDNRVAPEQLTLEITETALLADGARSLAIAEGLRALGVHLSIDDFGTGFSSLSYLRMLPATELKVDRSFVTNMLLDDRDEVIVRSTIDLGHNLGMHIAAEGVEDEATIDRLRLLGCELAQGYGISPPLPFDRFLVWLNSGRYPVARSRSLVDDRLLPLA